MIKFGTGGWRAVIADEFTKENIRLLMAGLCRLMEKEGLSGAEVCVGYDRRFLSKESAHWAAEVLVGYGFHPFVINRSSPTPLMMFTVKKRGEPYGIAVTASHNPAIYNGIKVFTAGGRDADETVTARIEAEIAQVTPADVKSVDYDEALAGGLITEANPMNEYLDSILSAVDVEAIKNAALRIGFDPMYGVSWSSLSMLLTTCRCDLEIIHDRHDTLFGGKLPAPNMETLKPLAALVLDKHCDLGIATDGDADRLGVIDNEGQFIHPNKLLVLLYYYLVKYRGWHGPASATTPPATCWTAWPQGWARNATRCRWASSGCLPRWRRRTPSSAASPLAAWPFAATSPARTASTPPRCWWRCWPSPGSRCRSCSPRSPSSTATPSGPRRTSA